MVCLPADLRRGLALAGCVCGQPSTSRCNGSKVVKDFRQPFSQACRGRVVPEDSLKTVYMDQGLAILQPTPPS